MDDKGWQTATSVLRLSTQLVDGIQAGMVERGFADVRPVHGFVFSALTQGTNTASGLAAHLEITKQAAAQLVSYLVDRGYVTREADPSDGRAQLVTLTRRGVSATSAAREAAEQHVDTWRRELSAAQFDALADALNALGTPGRLRPNW
ncbi:MarR family winged helix-turn-helix transcriptional regulator [Gordonia rubripertincta]|uniref:MarR family winged helix-turn-helix transcriptional regulator n=1 Tax=Gordonia rubripertincta TaxID=36822 RepID=A0ABT4MV10_GORRU|nr:MarR family winged helix-turn-helix transcriptional regulator [Gordonia rubripertincta]MCZ4550842.1 MarR family winged helix-turn-helix transcriptional regulator [Gordonia rubripertincta]